MNYHKMLQLFLQKMYCFNHIILYIYIHIFKTPLHFIIENVTFKFDNIYYIRYNQ